MSYSNPIKKFSITPEKKHGQNFLVDKNIISIEIDEAGIDEDDTVLEIGAGYGALTIEIARKAKKVIACEIDGGLVSILEKRIQDEGISNIDIVEGDFLKEEIPRFDKCISNIPYKISSRIIERLSGFGNECILIMQKEFAKRLVAEPGEKDYSRITILSNFYFIPVYLRTVGKGCFFPSPKVDSAMVRLVPRNKYPDVSDTDFFFQFIKAVFIHKNQKLWKAVSHSKRELGLTKEELKNYGKSLEYSDHKVKDLDISRLAKSSDELKALIERANL